MPFIMLSRSLMMYSILQLFYLYMHDKKIEFKQFRNISIFIVGLILIFESKYQDIDKKIYEKLTIEGWINCIFFENESNYWIKDVS